jgi:hypothetical protein
MFGIGVKILNASKNISEQRNIRSIYKTIAKSFVWVVIPIFTHAVVFLVFQLGTSKMYWVKSIILNLKAERKKPNLQKPIALT